MSVVRAALWAAVGVAVAAGPARAQSRDDSYAIEVPVLITDVGDEEEDLADTSDLDLSNVVQTAARGVTTVQEAPAIVTVITAEQMRDRHVQSVEHALNDVPGWQRYGSNHSQFTYALSRGTFQAVLLMRDGVSMFDPMINVASFNKSMPLETVRRVEIITGPAGVLWGANSFLGLVNVITKTGGDIEGVESSVGYGSGPGNPDNLRGYVMAGGTDVLVDDLEVMAHASFETFRSPRFGMPSFLYHSPQPQPNSLLLYGPFDEAEPAASTAFNVNLNAQYGNWRLRASAPKLVENKSLTFAGGVVNEEFGEDDLPECQMTPPGGALDDPPCIDRDERGRRSQFQFYERFASLGYETQLGGGRAIGLRARGYGVQFVRRWTPLQIMVPVSTVLPGGLAFETDVTTYRVGATADAEVELTTHSQALFGVEAFREWLPDRIETARDGPGAETTFPGPYNLDLLPLPCPLTARWDDVNDQLVDIEPIDRCPLKFANQVDRAVLGAYGALHWRLSDAVMLDGGVRVQAAPAAIGKRDYEPQLLGSGALVYKFLPRWHMKVNYTQGFRPPVFNNTDLNGEAVSFPGSPDLQPERSEAYQVEVNARIPTPRRVREIALRADYSYTVLDNLIAFPQGQYVNGGERGIHSAEFLGQLNIDGGHRVDLSYTWLRVRADDLGDVAGLPEHWFSLGVVARLNARLSFTTTARVTSAFADPNRLVEYRDLSFGDNGSISPDPASGQSVVVQPYELVLDRIPPAVDLNAGLQVTGMDERLVVRATVYNALDARNYQPDATNSHSPRLDILPNPYERIAFFLTASYRPAQ